MSDARISDFDPARIDVRSASTDIRPDGSERFRNALSGLGGVALRAEPAWGAVFPDAPARDDAGEGSVSGRRRLSPRGGSADGNPFRQACGRGDLHGPNFNLEVPEDGYAWWYVDGVSDCGTRAISIIAFIGSVFSPWYKWSGRRRPHNHVCINVATYGTGGRFTMTDRGERALRQTNDTFEVGPSKLTWDGGKRVIDVDELASPPLPGRVQGRITLPPTGVTGVEAPLLPDGSHVWRPFAPTARIDVDLNRGWEWSGHGYFDANFGTRALETDFSYWTWGRFPVPGGAACFYDAERRDGGRLELGVKFTDSGEIEPFQPPRKTRFTRTLWAVKRETRADPGYRPKQVKAMLDAPFYSRSVVRTKINGMETDGVHEALDLDRFASPLLKPMLAVRVPRRPGWTFRD